MNKYLAVNQSDEDKALLRLKSDGAATVDLGEQTGAVHFNDPILDIALTPSKAAVNNDPTILKINNFGNTAHRIRFIPGNKATATVADGDVATLEKNMVNIGLRAYERPEPVEGDAIPGIGIVNPLESVFLNNTIKVVNGETVIEHTFDNRETLLTQLNTIFTGVAMFRDYGPEGFDVFNLTESELVFLITSPLPAVNRLDGITQFQFISPKGEVFDLNTTVAQDKITYTFKVSPGGMCTPNSTKVPRGNKFTWAGDVLGLMYQIEDEAPRWITMIASQKHPDVYPSDEFLRMLLINRDPETEINHNDLNLAIKGHYVKRDVADGFWMDGLPFNNANQEKGSTVRLLKRTSAADGVFTDADDLFPMLFGSSVTEVMMHSCDSIPRITVNCTGAETETPVMEIDGATSIAFGNDRWFTDIPTPELLVRTLRDYGFEVEVIDEPVEPDDDITEIFLTNTKMPAEFKMDGTENYVMKASLIRDGVTTDVPFKFPLTSPPFSPPVMDRDPFVALFWLMNVAPQTPGFEDLTEYFGSSIFTMADPSEAVNLAKFDLYGNKKDAVKTINKTQLKFSIEAANGTTDYDLYSRILNTDYPNTVTLTSWGPMARSLVDKGSLSANGKTFAYRHASNTRGFGARIFNTETLAYNELDLIVDQQMLDAENVGRMFTSDDGTVIMGVVDSNSNPEIRPMYGWTINIDSESNELITWTVNDGLTLPLYLGAAAISPDNKTVIFTGGSGSVVIAVRNENDPNNYIVTEIIENTELFPNSQGIMEVSFLNNTTFIARGYGNQAITYYGCHYSVDTNPVGITISLMSRVDYTYTDGFIVNENCVTLPNKGIIDQVRGKVIYVDATDINNISTRELWSDGDEWTASGDIPYTNMYLVNVEGQDKFVYAKSPDRTLRITVLDFDSAAVTLTNPVKDPTVFTAGEVVLFSRTKAVVAVMELTTTLKERTMVVKANNTLVDVDLPLTTG